MSATLERVYLDSSVLVGAVIEGANHAIASMEFCRQLARERTTVVISTLCRYELAHVASVLANPEARRRLPGSVIEQFDLTNWGDVASVRERWMTTVVMSLESLLGSFDELAEIPVLPNLWHAAIPIMIEHNIQSYDALHVATARSVEVADFATTDRLYSGIDGLTIHTNAR
jgi:predicted nucleic acid-binding protein